MYFVRMQQEGGDLFDVAVHQQAVTMQTYLRAAICAAVAFCDAPPSHDPSSSDIASLMSCVSATRFDMVAESVDER